jgi:hypothetical protein
VFALFHHTVDVSHRTRDAVSAVPAERRDGRYFTDGVNLYRMVDAPRKSSGHAVVGLEDCRSFDVILLTARKFRALRLRPVRAASSV